MVLGVALLVSENYKEYFTKVKIDKVAVPYIKPEDNTIRYWLKYENRRKHMTTHYLLHKTPFNEL